MEHERIGIKAIGEILKDEYLRLLAKYIGVEEEKLFQYTEGNPVRYIFEYPESLDLNDNQLDKLLELRRWRQLFDSLKELEGKDVIKGPGDVACLCADLNDEQREHFVMLLLNTKNEVIKKSTISIGSLNSSLVHPREVFKEAIKYSAASVILIHNHPSGSTSPSEQDINITNRLADGGKILGIRVLDHIIVGKNGYTSMKEQKLIDENSYCFEKPVKDGLYKEIRER